jgi:hypothetical protein
MDTLSLFAIYLGNGFVYLAYILLERLATLALLFPLLWITFGLQGFSSRFNRERTRPYVMGMSALCVASSILSPPPVPVAMLLMALASVAALRLERYRPDDVHWSVIRNMSLYALAGMGFTLFQTLVMSQPFQAGSTSMGLSLAKGRDYMAIVIGISMYVMPVMHVVMLSKEFLAHPPSERDERVIETIKVGVSPQDQTSKVPFERQRRRL